MLFPWSVLCALFCMPLSLCFQVQWIVGFLGTCWVFFFSVLVRMMHFIFTQFHRCCWHVMLLMKLFYPCDVWLHWSFVLEMVYRNCCYTVSVLSSSVSKRPFLDTVVLVMQNLTCVTWYMHVGRFWCDIITPAFSKEWRFPAWGIVYRPCGSTLEMSNVLYDLSDESFLERTKKKQPLVLWEMRFIYRAKQ